MAPNQNYQELLEKAAAGSLAHEVEQSIKQGRFKDAVKQAKLCMREAATPENHRLLERAYLLRADQLRQDGMATAAQEVAGHLWQLGITDPALMEHASGLLLAVGMVQESQSLLEQIESPEAHERFERQMADLLVIHPEQAPEVSTELRQGGQAVRAAITAVQAGDEVQGLALVREIARNSPFADWKLFVRGLAAHGRQEQAEAAANWDRLDTDRAAAKIVRGLRTLKQDAAAARGSDGAGTETLEKQVFGASVLGPFQEFQAMVARSRWTDAFKRLPAISRLLAQVDASFPERLTRILYELLHQAALQEDDFEDAERLVKGFQKVTPALAIDPKWNRFWALFWEQLSDQEAQEDAEEHWRRYLRDLESVACLKPDERLLARALVHNRLAKHVTEILRQMEACPCPKDHTQEPEYKAKQAAVEADLEASLKLAPGHLPTYRQLMAVYDQRKQPGMVVNVARRLLERFPDDYEALIRVAEQHRSYNEPNEQLIVARRARALKPLDPQALYLEWAAHLTMARNLALKKRWDEGRAELAEALRIRPDSADMLFIRANRAIFERKAGQPEQAQALVDEALATVPEPAPVWLALQIEAIRFKLSRPEINEYKKNLVEELKKKPTGETAGSLAGLMLSYLTAKVEYTGRVGHVKDVITYIRRTEKIKYTLQDLMEVCYLLDQFPKERSFHKTLLAHGIKLFPQAALLRFNAAMLEISNKKGLNWRSEADARKHLEVARKLADASQDPVEIGLQPRIRDALSLLDQMAPEYGFDFDGPAFGRGQPGNSAFNAMFNAMQAMFGGLGDDDDDEWDDDDDEWEEDDHDDTWADDKPFKLEPGPKRPKIGRKLPPKRKKKGR